VPGKGNAPRCDQLVAKTALTDDGRRLLARVRDELGSGYEVVYFDGIAGQVQGE
jgi:hypothetical protein